MTTRPEFGKPARSFAMTVSLQEGYEGGPVHQIEEVFKLIESFAVEHDVELGCEIISSNVMYSYRSQGKMVVHNEPAVKLVGLFPPNKFGQFSDKELVQIIELLAGYLAGPLGQTSFHAEVCGVHYSWKVAGEMTAHELAQRKSAPRLTEEQLIAELKIAGLEEDVLIKRALHTVKLPSAHGNEERLGGGSVLEEHIYPVTSSVLKLSRELPRAQIILRVLATLGHDLVEDTEVTLSEIRRIFGEDVARLIEILTDTGKTTDEYFRIIKEDEDARVIKVCDRWNNVLCAHKIPERDDIITFCDETVRYVLPMAESVCQEAAQIMSSTVTQLRSQVSA